MYRQIMVTPGHQPFERIVWRFSSNSPIEDYQLLTVTYGTAAAPFLATRALVQLADDEEVKFPIASRIAKSDFYVDDLMSGAENEENANVAWQQLSQLTEKGGFPLLKWASNSHQLMNSIPREFQSSQAILQIATEEDAVVSTLGLNWNTKSDHFTFKVKSPSPPTQLTKRTLLSKIAKIFDPLGWCAPVAVKAKILFQDLWKSDFGWDDTLVEPTAGNWKRIRDSLHHLKRLSIPRFLGSTSTTSNQLHGFCDASERAYAAAVYLRVCSENQITVHLVSAKTRVAPTKIISLPRLESCGALLLSSLMNSVQESLHLKIDKVMAWTDSTVTLEWIKSHPSRWKTFIAKRVTKIQAAVPPDTWHHVPGIENPADCASRGIQPEELINHPLWWHGPQWLLDPSLVPGTTPALNPEITLLEERKVHINFYCSSDNEIFWKQSSLSRVKRIIGWCLRFISNLRNRLNRASVSISPLAVAELHQALIILIKKSQEESFPNELHSLLKQKPLRRKSRILSLNPFLDSDNLIRVGGRIQKSEVSLDQQHPILLPRSHHLTTLVIRHLHLLNHHAGAQLLQSIISRQYWIVNARDTIRHHIRKCVTCIRHRAATAKQMIADLPKERVTAARAFQRCGVDYAGYFKMKSNYGRSNTTFKAYICLFVCFSTRALHLEVVSSLSTDSFLAALRRFISRRGKPADIFSDQGTNFVGAANDLKEFIDLVTSETHNHHLADDLSKDGIQWHFNSASAPHLGGIWEAGVKSVKHHLIRIIGDQRLNFEKFTKIIAQIEATLNSRPLTELSSDPNDLSCLTPAHFLISGPLISVPEPDLTLSPTYLLAT